MTELIKRRLESVASTGSSASSGFIEDKSYSDSEDDEEGKRSLPHPKSFLGKTSVTWLVPHTLSHTLQALTWFGLLGMFYQTWEVTLSLGSCL